MFSIFSILLIHVCFRLHIYVLVLVLSNPRGAVLIASAVADVLLLTSIWLGLWSRVQITAIKTKITMVQICVNDINHLYYKAFMGSKGTFKVTFSSSWFSLSSSLSCAYS